MKKYNINVRETLEKVVEIEAETSNEAVERAQNLYDDEEIVLDFMDYVGVEITDMDKEEEDLRKLDEHKKCDAVYKMINNFMAEIPLWMFEAVYFEERDNLINLGAMKVIKQWSTKMTANMTSMKTGHLGEVFLELKILI